MPDDVLRKPGSQSSAHGLGTEVKRLKQPSLWRSFGHALAGTWWVFRTQRNARIHTLVAACVVGGGVWLQLDAVRWALLTLTIVSVLVGEAVNTVIEALVDLLSPEYHERARIAKDAAAGAVLLLSLAAVIVGLLILGPPLWTRLR